MVETCARHGIHVMMEKPLVVSLTDALAMQEAGQKGHIQVLVNYETSWYRSNHAAQELLKSGAIGPLTKVVQARWASGAQRDRVQRGFSKMADGPENEWRGGDV